MKPEPITIRQDRLELTAKVVVEGAATGILMGGNLNMLGRSVGWTCPSFAGSILLIEAVDTFSGAAVCGCLALFRYSDLRAGIELSELADSHLFAVLDPLGDLDILVVAVAEFHVPRLHDTVRHDICLVGAEYVIDGATGDEGDALYLVRRYPRATV